MNKRLAVLIYRQMERYMINMLTKVNFVNNITRE